jgi:hypothetical protein
MTICSLATGLLAGASASFLVASTSVAITQTAAGGPQTIDINEVNSYLGKAATASRRLFKPIGAVQNQRWWEVSNISLV